MIVKKCFGDRVLVRLIVPAERTQSGLHIATGKKSPTDVSVGEVLIKGPEVSETLLLGDKVTFFHMSGSPVVHNGLACAVIRELELSCAVECEEISASEELAMQTGSVYG